MLAQTGQTALCLALVLSLFQAGVGLHAVLTHNTRLMRWVPLFSYGQLLAVTVSFFCLMFAFVSNDFTLTYVSAHSSSALPLGYHIAATWAAHEGSMLLWVFILSVWVAALSVGSKVLSKLILTQMLVVLALILVGFYGFILFTSNPFAHSVGNLVTIGHDLNPLLQDPGMMLHPPLLYLGIVGLAIPFAFAISALWNKTFAPNVAKWLRHWVMLVWIFLTLGIVLGSWWAYRELGWGGWWFWDPVENSALMPWLMTTALMHALIVVEKKSGLKSWTVLLCLCGFGLSLIGTFLVRSGVLVSVHSFASDPERGDFILWLMFLFIGPALLLYALRSRYLMNSVRFGFFSREFFISINNMLLFVSMASVLLGTVYPLISDTLGWAKVSVGASYFNLVITPLFVPLLLGMGVAPFLTWGEMAWQQQIKPLLWLALVCLGLAASIPIIIFHSHYWVIVGLFLAFWVMFASLYSGFRSSNAKVALSKIPMLGAHIGLSVMIVGVVLVSAYSAEDEVELRVGETAGFAQHQFKLAAVKVKPGPNYQAAVATVAIDSLGHQSTQLHPEYRVYTVAEVALPKIAIDVGWNRDLFVALGRLNDDNYWSLRLYYKPFIRWIWVGGLLMALSGVATLLVRRKGKKRC